METRKFIRIEVEHHDYLRDISFRTLKTYQEILRELLVLSMNTDLDKQIEPLCYGQYNTPVKGIHQ